MLPRFLSLAVFILASSPLPVRARAQQLSLSASCTSSSTTRRARSSPNMWPVWRERRSLGT
jgi:hypothetical protein